jgi:hypothetical protein
MRAGFNQKDVGMNDKDISTVIASALSDVYSWTSINLEEDFADYVTENCPHLSREAAIKILKAFDQIDPLERDSASFPLIEFVQHEIDAL